MFRTNRKRQLRNRVIAAALGVTVMTFGIWLNYNDASEEDQAETTVKKVEVDDEGSKENEVSDKSQDKRTDTIQDSKSYLIEEDEGVVKVFICDGNKNKELYLITSIPFDLLSESDQELFKEGVYLDTEEDLGKFLENFDS